MRTYRQLAEIIQSRITGGLLTPDVEVTLTEIAIWIQAGIAVSIKKDYADGVQLDNLEYVGDAYYGRFLIENSVEDELSGLMSATLPGMPVSMPRGYDIVSATFVPVEDGTKIKGLRLSPQQSDYYQELSLPSDMIPFWTNGSFLFYDVVSGVPNVQYNVVLIMAGAAVPPVLDAVLPAPIDAEPFIIDYVLGKMLPTERTAKDRMNDGNNTA